MLHCDNNNRNHWKRFRELWWKLKCQMQAKSQKPGNETRKKLKYPELRVGFFVVFFSCFGCFVLVLKDGGFGGRGNPHRTEHNSD